MKLRSIVLGSLLYLAWPAGVGAHDILLEVAPVDSAWLEGYLRYSDDAPAAGNYVRITDISDDRFSEIATTTDAGGGFRVAGVAGHRYAVTAEGDEGHSVTVEVTLAPARGGDGTSESGVPVYVVLAAVLLLSLIPARLLRRDRGGNAETAGS